MLHTDSRIPVLFATLAEAGLGDAVLVAADAVIAAGPAVVRLTSSGAWHARGCNCCVPRSAAAQTMTALFHARARGEMAFFRRLVVVLEPAQAMQVRAALGQDHFVAGRYREVPGGISRTSPGIAAGSGSWGPARG